MNERKTKIVASIGPKSESVEMIDAFVKNGIDIARMNFSHCTYDEYKMRKERIEGACKKYGRDVKIMQDLRGPRIRVGALPDSGVDMVEGIDVMFSTDVNDTEAIYISDDYLHLDINVGEPLYLANGDMELEVIKKDGKRIWAKVIRGGKLFSKKAVNTPKTKLTTSGLTNKDREDVKFALECGVDYIALSFVQSAKDILDLREMIGDKKVKVIAKIEMAVALDNLDEILKVSDGVMVARGDLGCEIPLEKVPYAQKFLINQADWHGKSSITATQMLTSMMNNPKPTRAEVSDIANAVWQGTDAVMMSDETAAGNYPLEALQTMDKIVREAEKSMYRENLL